MSRQPVGDAGSASTSEMPQECDEIEEIELEEVGIEEVGIEEVGIEERVGLAQPFDWQLWAP